MLTERCTRSVPGLVAARIEDRGDGDRQYDGDDDNDFKHVWLRMRELMVEARQRRNGIKPRRFLSRSHSPPHTIRPR